MTAKKAPASPAKPTPISEKTQGTQPVAPRPEKIGQKTVLILTLGTSPAVLTETVWALAHPVSGDAVIPDRIEILTTKKGEEIFQKEVIQSGIWKNLRNQLVAGKNVGRLELCKSTFVEEHDETTGVNKESTDIRSSDDTQRTADAMLKLVKKHAGARVIASISGGRKSMSALLYGVMSVAGKRGDRIVHVVSDPRFGEFPARDFFFPGQGGSVTLTDRDKKPIGKPFICSEMRSDLADLPFVPLGDKFVELRESHADFSSLVNSISGELTGKIAVAVYETHLVLGVTNVTYAAISMPNKMGYAVFQKLFITPDFSRKAKPMREQAFEAIPKTELQAGATSEYVSKRLNALRRHLGENCGWPEEKTTRIFPDLRKWGAHRDYVTVSTEHT